MRQAERITTAGHIALWIPGEPAPLGFYRRIDKTTIMACKSSLCDKPDIKLFADRSEAERWIAA